ncbi:heterokaryon incompatibility protein-domain-containing protein [Cubamyces lactineus]|nr:heterokaryon incompatibility protein-domain-containing protein [Cubamyces lactineus]
MWLLNTTTYRLHFEPDPAHASYAILSHVWHAETEQSFQDLLAIQATSRKTFHDDVVDDDPQLLGLLASQLAPKIRNCCSYALARGYRFVWIDTCCIDKTSSAELSEAINSMFDWYSYAEVCYVFLADVGDEENPMVSSSDFSGSAWFTRGWTLQELLVPRNNIFLSRDWRMLGTKASLVKILERVTGVDRDVLLHVRPLHSVSVARRLSWASCRETTRVEDEAYSLMGLFGIRMPTVYGEGRQAFIRLQEEILKRIPDQSLFAWGPRTPLPLPGEPMAYLTQQSTDELRASKGAYLFATSPQDFRISEDYAPIPYGTFCRSISLPASVPPLHMTTGHGIRTSFPILRVRLPCGTTTGGGSESWAEDSNVITLGLLACIDSNGHLLALLLSETEGSSVGEYLIGALDLPPKRRRASAKPRTGLGKGAVIRYSRTCARIMSVDPSWFSLPEAIRGSVTLQDVCIPYQRLQVESELLIFKQPLTWPAAGLFCPCQILLPRWTLAHFRDFGITYDVEADEDEMEPVRLDPTQPTYVLRLRYPGLAEDVVVTLSMCPLEGRALEKPLHVAVSWTGTASEPGMILETASGEQAGLSSAPQDVCGGTHVGSWGDGERIFSSPSGQIDFLAPFALVDTS